MNESNTPLEGTKLAAFEPRKTVTELEVIDTTEGTGAVVEPGATITAHYTGALVSDGTIFRQHLDSTKLSPAGHTACRV